MLGVFKYKLKNYLLFEKEKQKKIRFLNIDESNHCKDSTGNEN